MAIMGTTAWIARDLAEHDDWKWRYDDDPALSSKIRAELVTGRGVALVRGLPVEGLTDARAERLAIDVARRIGDVVPQGAGGELVRHVRDIGVDPNASTSKSYMHSAQLSFHADPTDVVGLLCLQPAKSGGRSAVLNTVAVHDEIVRTRPDLAHLLYQPWWHDARDGTVRQRPLYTRDGTGRLSAAWGLDYLRSAQNGAAVPAFTPAQSALIDLLDELTHDPRFAFTMDLRAGDLQFLNNRVTMHDRTAYVDHPEPRRRRHLIRIWLNTPTPAS
jgi:alpha-ketoglutarate-dependent taurine dioxygenase